MDKLTIKVIIGQNPYAVSSASANRWRTLLDGLAELGTSIDLLIFSGYQTEEEKIKFQQSGEYENICYRYLNPVIYNGYWGKRFYHYIGHYFSEPKIKNKIYLLIKNSNALIWTDSSQFGFEIAYRIRKRFPSKKMFLELSEFLDIHKYNKGNALQRRVADKRQLFFERKAFFAYNGMALMTRTLLKHYDSFPQPRPKLFHLPMTVDLDRFADTIEPLKDFEQPYIAFVGVMNDAKDGVNILIEAFAKIQKQFPLYKLYLIGGWNYDTPNHKKMIKENGLENKVFWKGGFSRDKIPANNLQYAFINISWHNFRRKKLYIPALYVATFN